MKTMGNSAHLFQSERNVNGSCGSMARSGFNLCSGEGEGLMTIDLGLNLFGDRKVLLVITQGSCTWSRIQYSLPTPEFSLVIFH